jgi:hypothetical protein
VTVEPGVLPGDRCIFGCNRDLVERDRQAVLRVEGGQRNVGVAVLRVDGGRLGERVHVEVLGETLKQTDRVMGRAAGDTDRGGHGHRH